MAFRTMTSYTAELLKGPLPMLGSVLDLHAPFNATQLANITGGVIPKGRIVSFNSSRQWRLGVGSTNATAGPGYLLMNNSDDLDVVKDRGGNPSTDAGAWVPGMPSGRMQGISLLQGHLMQVGEFDATLNYAVNSPLNAPLCTDDNDGDELLEEAGVLTNDGIKPYKQAIVGWVTEAWSAASPTTNAHRKNVLTFVSDYVPALELNPAPTWV